MKVVLAILLGGGCLVASDLMADPLRQLGATELDTITAGAAEATAGGSIGSSGLVTGDTQALALRSPSSRSDEKAMGATTYAADGTSTGFTANGEKPNINSSATTGSDVPGARTTTMQWEQSQLGVTISSAWSHTSAPDRQAVLNIQQ